MKRVISYIDGFNMYYGLKSKGWERYLLLDVQALSRNLLKTDQSLVHTKYFTARISSPAPKVKGQNTYIEAIQTLSEFPYILASTRPTRTRAATVGSFTKPPRRK